MRKKFEWEWEVLDIETKRAKVIGGWIILHKSTSVTLKGNFSTGESMVFIPDRDHEFMIVPKMI